MASAASPCNIVTHLAFQFFLQPPPEPAKRIVKFIHDTFLEWNDSVVGDLNAFGTNFCTALGDVAVTNSLCISQFVDPIFGIERMHFERGDVNQISWPNELFMHPMIAQDVANILAKEAFDAFPKFLDAIDIFLLHSPGSVRRIGRTRLELLDLLLHSKIP